MEDLADKLVSQHDTVHEIPIGQDLSAYIGILAGAYLCLFGAFALAANLFSFSLTVGLTAGCGAAGILLVLIPYPVTRVASILFNLLMPVIICGFLTVLYCLYRFLRK